MANDPTLKDLYSAVDQRKRGNTVNAITERLRSEYDIATGEGMVGTRELVDSIRTLNIAADTRLVDLGSGTAEPSRWIASATGCRLVAVDVSRDRVAHVPIAPGVVSICADLDHGLPFRDSVFTACVQYDSIVHIADRDTYLDELRRIVEPGSALAPTSSGGFERLVSRAEMVASLLEQQRLDMVFLTAFCRS